MLDVADGARFAFLRRLDAISGAQAALAYVLAHPDVSCAVMGTTRIAHLKENLEASGRRLEPALLSRIEAAQGFDPLRNPFGITGTQGATNL